MEYSNKEKLLNLLIEKTKAEEIDWQLSKSLYNIENFEETNPNAYYLVFQNEFHHVFNDSYYAAMDEGNVYLLHEEFESGRDGSVTRTYNLYIQERDEDDCLAKTVPLCISDDECELKELREAIEAYLNKADTRIENFLKKLISHPR